jgi:hypothetical protein
LYVDRVVLYRVDAMTKPRRKKKYLLLLSTGGTLIVGSRLWYDQKRVRYDRRWKIVTQSDDESMLTTMAMLTDKHLGMTVINTIEEN